MRIVFPGGYRWTRWSEREDFVSYEESEWVGDPDLPTDHVWAVRFETAKRLLWNEYGDEVLRPLWKESVVEGDVVALLGEPENVVAWVVFNDTEVGELVKEFKDLPDDRTPSLHPGSSRGYLPDNPIFTGDVIIESSPPMRPGPPYPRVDDAE